MKTKEDVYKRMLELHNIGVSIIFKYSIYIPDVSFEFTEFPTVEKGIIRENIEFLPKIRIMLYVNETYDIMCDRIDKFLQQRQDFLNNCATDDFKQLINYIGLAEYLRNKDTI